MLTSLLVLPWTFKFVLGSLIDSVRTQRWTLRSWILSAQFLMGVTLAPLLFLNATETLSLLAVILFAHAVVAATQDAAIDALAIAIVPASERGRLNAWMQAGMLVGRSLLGGGALLVGARLGNGFVVLVLVAVILSSAVLLLLSKQECLEAVVGGTPFRLRAYSFLAHASAALRQRTTWMGLLFACLGGAAFEATAAVAGPFLIDRGFSVERVGMFFAVPSVAAMIVGALAGGYIADRIGKPVAVTIFLLWIALDVLLLAGADSLFGESAGVSLVVLLGVLYVGIGLFTAGSYALFMDITDPRLAATQFSAFMGATNGCESWSTFAAGKLVSAYGYGWTFGIMSCVSLLAIPLLRKIKAAPR
jgi:MFS transporter, PAT family, beta-lactamase induction signal transducer AmpG